MPVRIDGHAIGSSIRLSTCMRFIPTPRAASVIAGLTASRPMIVFRMIGSRAYKINAVIVGATPRPRNRNEQSEEGE